MNLNEIVLEEHQALIPDIIDGIQEIAINLNQNEQFLIRRDLVKNLNEQIPGLNLADGRIIKSLVKEAYLTTNSPIIKKAILECFYENTGDQLVYDPNRISDVGLSLSVPSGDPLSPEEFALKAEVLERNVQILGERDFVAEISEMTNEIDHYVAEDNFSLTGRTKVNDTTSHAKKVLQGYNNFVNHYEWAKQTNLALIVDFEKLRDELGDFRKEITELLFSIIGDDKKDSYPDLFDFSEIEYFDIEKIRGKIELAHSGIDSRLEIFKTAYGEHMQDIKQAGLAHADKALDTYSKTIKRKGRVSRGEVKGQVALAALGFAFDAFISVAESRKNAEETVALIKRDLESMKLYLKEDAQKIAEDLIRLKKIHSKLKEILIPRAKNFINRANIIFNSTVKGVYAEIVSSGTIEELSRDNRKLAAEQKQVFLEIEDKKLGIKICEDQISEYEDLKNDIQFEYNYVNDIKPNIPNLFHQIISFGIAKSNYHEHLADWNRITEPVRNDFNFYVDTLNYENEVLIRFNDILLKLQNRLKEIDIQREHNLVKIKEQKINLEDFKPQLELFENSIRQLAAALKNLLEARISENLTKIPHRNDSGGSLNTEISEINAFSVSALTEDDIAYLSDKKYQMDMKVELLAFAEFLFTGDIVVKFSNLDGENKEIFIKDQMIKAKTHLTSKIVQNSGLNQLQATRLMDLGADIFSSILRTQKVNAETNFLREFNTRLDQEFLKQFEILLVSLNVSLQKDQQEAEVMESALNEAVSAEDLLKATHLVNNN